MIHRRTMLRGDCPAVVRRGLEASRRAYTTPSLSFSPLFPSLPREREKREKEGREEEGYILVPVGMGAFRISDIKADTASIPLKYHASVASTRDFSSPRWRRQSLSRDRPPRLRLNELILSRLWPLRYEEGERRRMRFSRERRGRGREFAVGSACDVSLSSS